VDQRTTELVVGVTSELRVTTDFHCSTHMPRIQTYD
jgi:hypothetical protein